MLTFALLASLITSVVCTDMYLLGDAYTWEDCISGCQANGDYTVVPTSQDENNEVAETCGWDPTSTSGYRAWLGLTRDCSSGCPDDGYWYKDDEQWTTWYNWGAYGTGSYYCTTGSPMLDSDTSSSDGDYQCNGNGRPASGEVYAGMIFNNGDYCNGDGECGMWYDTNGGTSEFCCVCQTADDSERCLSSHVSDTYCSEWADYPSYGSLEECIENCDGCLVCHYDCGSAVFRPMDVCTETASSCGSFVYYVDQDTDCAPELGCLDDLPVADTYCSQYADYDHYDTMEECTEECYVNSDCTACGHNCGDGGFYTVTGDCTETSSGCGSFVHYFDSDTCSVASSTTTSDEDVCASGDLNDDGFTNVIDAVLLISWILEDN